MLTATQSLKTFRLTLNSVGAALVGALVLIWAGEIHATESYRHPMDPLTAKEYAAIVPALKEKNYVDENSRYHLITLEELPKTTVLQWKPRASDVVSRRAFVIARNGSQTFEGIVDVTDTKKGKVISWEQVEDVQPGILLSEEWTNAQQIVQADRDWQAAIRTRGINNLDHVVCVPHTIGYYGLAKEADHRLVKVTCYNSEGTKNFWARPIEGLIAVVDQDKHKVIELIDTGIVPVPKAPITFSQDSAYKSGRQSIPATKVQARETHFKINGHVITWHKWQFHYRIDPRLGPVVSMVRYHDHGKMRSILYEGSLSELFVPYMDPSVGWYFRTYMDAGEYGIGKLAAPLQPGLDCPSNAVFQDAVFADDWGDSYTQLHASCLFERDTKNISWRHYESEHRHSDVRKQTELVVRFISTIGSYDYIFDWIFRQDGTIKVALGATGIPQVKAVRSRTAADGQNRKDSAYGHMVTDHTVAINHDHFFSFRIDLDVDGQQNSFLLEQLKPERLESHSPKRKVWIVEKSIVDTESAAKLRINSNRSTFWRVINPNVISRLGYPVSYQLRPKTTTVTLLNLDDFAQNRAAWTNYHVWVTPYKPQERYAAGTYPNQSKGGHGLPRWTRANRPIQNTDIVLWYTLGMHHVVRTEDWPIMPTTWSEFELKPFDFFQHNPTLDSLNQPPQE